MGCQRSRCCVADAYHFADITFYAHLSAKTVKADAIKWHISYQRYFCIVQSSSALHDIHWQHARRSTAHSAWTLRHAQVKVQPHNYTLENTARIHTCKAWVCPDDLTEMRKLYQIFRHSQTLLSGTLYAKSALRKNFRLILYDSLRKAFAMSDKTAVIFNFLFSPCYMQEWHVHAESTLRTNNF